MRNDELPRFSPITAYGERPCCEGDSDHDDVIDAAPIA
jgi:hypothetical protein